MISQKNVCIIPIVVKKLTGLPVELDLKGHFIMSNKKHSIKDDFTMLAILTIPIGVAVNFVGGQLASTLKLPMYLDTIGTIFSAMLCGPWVGACTGLMTNIVNGFANPVNFAFIPVNLAVGLVTGFLSRKNMFRTPLKYVISVILITAVSVIIAAPIVVKVYGGVTGDGASIFTATMMAAGANIWASFFGTAGVFNVLDRIIATAISFAVIKVIPARTLVKFGCGENFIKKSAK